jgi:hypothetical protein
LQSGDPETELPSTSYGPLASALESLTATISAVVKECKENGTLATRRITYTLRPNFNLRYSLIRQL